MLQLLFAALTLTAMTASLWQRRTAFRSRWNRKLTGVALCMMAGIGLATPAVSRLIGETFGRQLLPASLGACLHVIGMAVFCGYLLSRVANKRVRRHFYRGRIVPAAVLSSALMVLMIFLAPDLPNIHDMASAPPAGWFIPFRLIYATVITYLAWAAFKCLQVAAQDPRSRTAAIGYTVAVALSWLPMPLYLLDILAHYHSQPMHLALMEIAWVTGMSSAIVFAGTASYTWANRWNTQLREMVKLAAIRSDPIRSDPIRSDPIRSYSIPNLWLNLRRHAQKN